MIVCQRDPVARRQFVSFANCACLLVLVAALFPCAVRATPSQVGMLAQLVAGSGEKATTGLASPSPTQTFAGIMPANSTPPDSHGAVSANHVVTHINGQSVIRDRNGNELASVSLQGFWSSLGVSDVFDPKVLYDPHSNRFIAVACAQRRSSASGMAFGVSATSDPTGNWHLWLLDADSANQNWVDYPSIGLTSSRITISGNLFSVSGDSFGGVNLWTIDTASAMDGGGLTMQLLKVTNAGGTLVPALTYDAGVSTQFIVRTGTSNLFGLGRLQMYSITGSIGALSFNQIPFASIGPAWSISLPNARQLGSTATIETNDDRLQNAVIRNGRLWTAHTVGFDLVTRDHAAVKWWEIIPGTGEVIQTGNIEDVDASGNFDINTGRYYYFPSVAVNSSNEVLIGFTGSGTLEHASCYYAFRPNTAGEGLFNEPFKYRAGSGAFNGPRWGDYSHTVVDPVDDRTFWTVQQFAQGGNQTANFWAKVGPSTGGDTTNPRVSGAAALTGTTVRVTFDETMQNNAALVNPANYTFTGGLTAGNVMRLNTTQVSVLVNEMRSGDSYSVSVSTSGPTDVAGNPVSASGNTASFTGLGTAPTAVISRDNPSPTNLNAVNFSVDFSESVGGTFTASDVTVTGSLASGAGVSVTGGPTNFTVRVTPSNPNGEGTIGISIGTGIMDAVGNTFAGATSPASYTLDNTSPAVGVNTLLTTDRTPQLTGTVNDNGASISVSVAGQTRTATNNGNGTWTLANNSLSAIADGTYNVVATATDAAGNSAADGTTNELTIDATAPSISVNSRVTNDNTPQLTGTVSEAGAAITIVVGGQTRSATNHGNGTWTLPDGSLNPLSDGVYNVSATAADAVGNMGSDGSNNELTVDTTAPALTVNPRVTNDTRPALSGTTSDPVAAISVNVGGQNRNATNNGNGTWTLADNAINPALAPGTYSVTARSTDAAGNTGTDGTSNELTIDITAPTVTVNNLTTNDGNPQITGAINDMSATLTLSVGGRNGTPTNNGNGTWTLPNNSFTALSQGTYNVTVTATDAAGNSASDSTTNELTIDTTAPTVTVNTLITSDPTPPLSGTVNDPNATLSVNVNGQVRTAINNGSTWSLANGSLSALPQGTYNVVVTATDTAGNSRTDSTTGELTIDTTAPTITVNSLTTSDPTPPLTGTVSETGAAIRVSVGSQTNLTATNNGNGTWTLPNNVLSALADGTYNVVATATDGAANSASDSTSNELTIDTTAPIVTVTALTTNDNRPPLSGTVNDTSASISISVGGQTRTATNNGNGTWTLGNNSINPPLADNTYNVTVTATDGAGNAGADGTTNELVIDTVAPVVTVTARTTNDTTPSLTGAINDNNATISVSVGGQTRSATNNGNGTWTLPDGSLNPLAGGTYNVAVTATDAALNTGADSTSNELVIDLTAPAIAVNTVTTNDPTPPLSGTINDNTAAISIMVGGQTRTATNNGNGTWSLGNNSLGTLADGVYNVVARATDTAGNTGTDGSNNELRVDTQAPVVTVNALSTTDTTPPLTGSVNENGAAISVSVGGQTRTATNNNNGTWTLANNQLSTLANGTYNVSVTATDAAGNAGTDSTTNELVVDNTPPVVTVNSLTTDDQRPPLTGTVNDSLATIRVNVDVHTNLVALNNGNGTWTLPDNTIPANLAAGTYNVSVTATDTLGNAGSDGTTNELTIDLTVPDIAVTVNSLATRDRTPALSGNVDDNAATIEVQVDGSTYTATNNGDGTWVLVDGSITNQLLEGVYDVQVTATNGAVTGVDTTNNELTIDLTPPAVTVATLATADNTPTLTGTTNTPNADIRVDVGGQNNLAATNNGNGTWTINIPLALSQGVYDVVVRATDTAGNIGTDSTNNELRVDSTAPAITVATRTTANNRPALSGTVSDTPAGGTLAVSVTVNGQTRSASVSGGAWMVASGAFNAIPDGTYNVQATATDEAGNAGNDATAGELTIDTTAPVVTVNSLNTNDARPPLTGTVNDNSAAIRVTVGGQINVLATNNADGTWTLPDNALATLSDGLYNVSVRATDPLGNTGADNTTDELRIDATAPSITVNALVTNNNRPGLSGTVNDTTATIAVTVSGNTVAATNNGNGTWTLAANVLPALAEGTLNVTARATDSFGNIGTDPTSGELVVDQTAPAITVDNFLTNDSTPPITGTVNDPAAAITVSVSGQLNLAAVNNGNGTWFLPDGALSPLADGTYNVSARATDVAGNAGTDGSTNELTINSQAPVITVNTLLTSDNTPPLDGTVDDPGATISVTVGSQSDVGATNDGDGTWSLADGALSTLADGVYNVIAQAVDAQGNTSMDGATGELTVDTTAPMVSVDPLLTNDNRPALSGTINDPGATIAIAVNGETGLAAVNNGDGTWTLPDNTIAGALPDSSAGYDVTATATDAVGNAANDTTANELRVDTVAPVVAVNMVSTNLASPRITGMVDDNFAQVNVTVNGETVNATNNSNGTWTLVSGLLSELGTGTYNIAVSATDLAGNTGNASLPDGLVVDVTPPAVSVDVLITTDTTPALTGTVDDAAAVVSVSVAGQTNTAANNGDGTWTLADDTLSALADGVYDVVVTATDALGNVGTESASNELTIDTSGPLVTIDNLITNDTTPALTGTIDEPGVAITVTVAGNSYNAANNGDGTWSLADNTIAPALTPGTYDLMAVAADGLGNIGADTSTDELIVDLAAPSVSVDSSLTTLASPNLTGTVDDIFATVTVEVGGQTRTATNIGNGTWALVAGSLDPLPSGVYDVAATATDLAGNASSDATTDELEVDLGAPVITVDELITNDSTPPLTGSVDDPAAAITVTVAGQTLGATNNGDGTWSIADNTLSPLADGAYNVLAEARDIAGNVGTDPTAVDDLFIVTVAPDITVLPHTTSDTTPRLNGLINQATSAISIQVGGQTHAANNNGDGTWTLPDDTLSPLAEGTYDVRAEATDLLGNTGIDTGSDELTINLGASLVTVDSLTTRDRTPPLSGTVSEPGVPVSITVGGATYSATNNGDGTWVLADDTIATLADGVYDVLAVAGGAVNSTDSTINELAIDTLGPSLVVGPPSVQSTRNGPVSFNLHYGSGALVGLLPSDVGVFSLLDPNVTAALGKAGGAIQKTFPISTATAEGTVSISGTGNSVRTVTVTDITGDGYMGIAVLGGSAVDAAGNPAPSAISVDLVFVDNTPPEIDAAGVANLGIITVTFEEPMNDTALDPMNYTISGPGRGTLAENPDVVIRMSPERYRLVWSVGSSVNGAEITITVINVADAVNNLLDGERTITVLVEGIGQAPVVNDVEVLGSRSIAVRFSEPIDMGALETGNYTLSGSGRGTLTVNPSSVAELPVIDPDDPDVTFPENRNGYRLTWDNGEMLHGGDITVAVSGIQDNSGDTIGTPSSGTDAGGGIGVGPAVQAVNVITGLTVEAVFSEAMGDGVLDPGNYTISGAGRGSLAANPDSVTLTGTGKYLLTWNAGEMLNGRDVTITAASVSDAAGNPLGMPDSATDRNAGRDGLITARIPARRDVTLYEDAGGTLANGAGTAFYAGLGEDGQIRRALLFFDVAGNIPAGSNVLETTLTLDSAGAGGAANRNLSLLRVDGDWSEGDSADGIDGAPAAGGDATWIHSNFDSDLWAAPGGDFTPGARATANVGGAGEYTWNSPELQADAQEWLDDPDNNFGWLLMGDEASNGSVKDFYSDEHDTAGQRPMLDVIYSLNGGPGGPVLGSIGDQTIEEGETLTLDLTAVDTSDNPVSISSALGSLPEGNDAVLVDNGNGSAQFNWTPTFTDAGSYVVTFIATQRGVANPLSISETIVIDVSELNQTPVFEDPGPLTATEGQLFTFTPVLTDNDAADSHSYSLLISIGDAEVDPATGQLTWTPGFSTAGTVNLGIVATDNGMPPASATLELTIEVSDANGPPAIAPIGDQVVVEGDNLSFNVEATDPDLADTLTFSLDSPPEGAAIDPETGMFRWTPSIITAGEYNVTFVVTDDGEPPMSDRQTVLIAVLDNNQDPTDIQLTPASIQENQPANTTVGTLTTVDPDAGDVHTYTLVDGAGDSDNGEFSIEGNSLVALNSLNFENRSSYSVRVQSFDGKDGVFARALTVSVVNVNDLPQSIALSNASVTENVPAGTGVGTLSTQDEDASNVHVYTLVDGDGATDNGLFAIDGNQLVTAANIDFETNTSLSVRVRSTDPAGAFVEAAFTIAVNNVNDTPDSVTLSNDQVAENLPAGTLVGAFMTEDADADDSHSYTLVAGSGSADNALFQIEGNELRTAAPIDFELGRMRSIRVRTSDGERLNFEMLFQIEILDRNDAPTNIRLSAAGILGDVPAETKVADILTTDQDLGDSHTYALVGGEGSANNNRFQIAGGALLTSQPVDFDSDTSFAIRIRTTDSDGAQFEKAFVLINDDTDADGLSDAWEVANFGNLLSLPGEDPDGDGLTNLEEFTLGTNPRNADSDGDGIPDGVEVTLGTDPNNVNNAPANLRVTPSTLTAGREATTLTLNVRNTGVKTLNWQAAVASGGNFVRISAGASGVNSGQIILEIDENTGASSRTATIRVSAPNASGSPVDIPVTQAACSTPNVPLDVVASNGSLPGQVRITWDPVSGADRYMVYRGLDTEPASAALIATVTGTAYTDDSAPPLGDAKQDGGMGCVLFPQPDADAYQYFIRATSACGTSAFSTPNDGFPGPGQPPARQLFEPVLPAIETENRTLTARADSPLAIRLRRDIAISPGSVSGLVEFAGGSSTDIEWLAIDSVGLTDGWAIYRPAEGDFVEGDTVMFTVSASTVGGESIGPLSFSFTIESGDQFLDRLGAGMEPIAQPAYTDFDAGALDLNREGDGLADIYALAEGSLPSAPAGAAGPAYAIVPDEAYGLRQRVWIPLEGDLRAEEVVVNYYFADKAGNETGWHSSGAIRGWSVEDSFLELEVGGVRYLGFLVRHGGRIQLSAAGAKAESASGAAIFPALDVARDLGGDGILLALIVLVLLGVYPRRGPRRDAA